MQSNILTLYLVSPPEKIKIIKKFEREKKIVHAFNHKNVTVFITSIHFKILIKNKL